MPTKRLSGYPSWFYGVLIASMLSVCISGFLLIPTALEFKFFMEVPWRLASSSFTLTVASHILTAWLLLMMVGAMWQLHMRFKWRQRNNHRSGLMLALLLVSLALTGTGLFYLGDETLQQYSSATHIIVGILVAVIMLWHCIHGAKLRKN